MGRGWVEEGWGMGRGWGGVPGTAFALLHMCPYVFAGPCRRSDWHGLIAIARTVIGVQESSAYAAERLE